MCGKGTSFEERTRSAAGVLARVLVRSAQSASRLAGKWLDDVFDREAIDEDRSGSIVEFRLTKWPPRFRLSVHSDDGGSLVGYGVFRPPGKDRRSKDIGLREYLEAQVPVGHTTPEHWAWYRDMGEPLRDLSRQETWIEVEKIRKGEKSKGDDAFRRASDDLARLAMALDSWYSKID